jgi:GAF domain-containing protein
MADREMLIEELSSFARKLITDYPITDALHDLTDAITAILGIRGAGVSLAQDGRLSFATAASEDVEALEHVQESEQEGPCVEAFRTGVPVLVTDLGAEAERWATFAEVAKARGIVSAAGIPLHLNGNRMGALDLYDGAAHAWTAEETRTAELLAAIATAYVVNASRLDQVRHTAEQLQAALDSRVVIEQAKGILAGERGVSVDEAFQLLRDHARNRGVSLRDVANAVVALGLRP